MQCGKSPNRNGGGFLIGHVDRFYGQRPVLRQTYVLSISTRPKTGRCKNLVTFLKQLYIFADGFNFPG